MSRHLETISNGLGAPSMALMWLAAQGRIPATVSITADTGTELDRLWSTGERTTAAVYFDQVVRPLAAQWGLDAYFVRAQDKHGTPMPSIEEHTEAMIAAGKLRAIKIPLFGSRGGRLKQVCTQRFKVTAVRQECRRLGATTVRAALGLHSGEAHRMRGANFRIEGGWATWNDLDGMRRARKGPTQSAMWDAAKPTALRKTGPQIEQILTRYGVQAVKHLPASQATALLTALRQEYTAARQGGAA